MNYTKGEWKISQHKSGALLITCEGKNVAVTSQATRIEDAQEISANAHLIAAAPEMYKALGEAIAMLKTLGHSHPDDEVLRTLIKQGQVALARAESKE